MSLVITHTALTFRRLGVLVAALMLIVTLLAALGACGDSTSGPGAGGSNAAHSSGGPDVAATQAKLLNSLNFSTEGKARFAEFKETSRKLEGEGDFQGCLLEFAGVIEFTGDCEYHGKLRKAGERLSFEAQAELVKDKTGWKQISMGLYPL